MEINFPAEYGWKESLMGDLEGRIKQVPEVGTFFSGQVDETVSFVTSCRCGMVRLNGWP